MWRRLKHGMEGEGSSGRKGGEKGPDDLKSLQSWRVITIGQWLQTARNFKGL